MRRRPRITAFMCAISVALGVAHTRAAASAAEQDRPSLWGAVQMIGVDADVLASLGMTGGQTSLLLSRLAQYESRLDRLHNLHIALEQRNSEIHSLEARLRVNPDDVHALVDLGLAEDGRAFFTQQIEFERAALLESFGEGLADVADLQALCSDDSTLLRLPAPYRFGASMPAEARAIAWALRVERRAQDAGVSAPPETAALLGRVRAEADVAAAISAHETRLAEVRAAVANWLSGG